MLCPQGSCIKQATKQLKTSSVPSTGWEKLHVKSNDQGTRELARQEPADTSYCCHPWSSVCGLGPHRRKLCAGVRHLLNQTLKAQKVIALVHGSACALAFLEAVHSHVTANTQWCFLPLKVAVCWPPSRKPRCNDLKRDSELFACSCRVSSPQELSHLTVGGRHGNLRSLPLRTVPQTT